MATRSLIEKIENLPDEKKAEVEHFVDKIAEATPPRFSADLLDKINAAREALYREQGVIDTDALLREFREHGGR